jgi:pimeloyl-ACP methyl ester carboxylesterase
LHTLLQQAGIAAPIVLVGYGLSGLSTRIYADRFPKEVAAMVLVNPTVPNQNAREAEVIPALAASFAQIIPFDESCTRAAQRGLMHPGTPAFGQCMYMPPGSDLPKQIIALIQRQWEQPAMWRDFTLSDRAAAASSAEVLREQRKYGDMPLIVLTSDIYAEHLPFTPPQQRALATAWRQWRDEVARLSSRGTNFVVSGATVNVAVDRPASIVSAINEVIDQTRSR